MADCNYRWLRTGDEAFAEMLAAIAEARQSVRLETYIFADSPLGARFREALVQAARRGTRVWVLNDGFGSLTLPDDFWVPLRQAGGQFRWFNPLAFERFTFRDHRKLLVCDEATAFVGGFNIAPEYEGDGVTRGWRDAGLRVCDAPARDLAASFDAMFLRAGSPHLPFTRFRRAFSRRRIEGDGGQLLLSSPGRGRNDFKRALMRDLAQAGRIQLVAAYFLPTSKLLWALVRAARRGRQVQIVLPAKSDLRISQLASQSLYPRLLRAGVELYEYEPQILHTKLVVVDGACYAGSANLDARSLHINYELMVRLTHPRVVGEARELVADHLRHSRRIEWAAWRASRSFWKRLEARWARFLLARVDPLLSRYQWRVLKQVGH